MQRNNDLFLKFIHLNTIVYHTIIIRIRNYFHVISQQQELRPSLHLIYWLQFVVVICSSLLTPHMLLLLYATNID